MIGQETTLEAVRHIAEAKGIVAKQRERIDKLKAAGISILLDAVSAFPELISKSKNQHHFEMIRLLAR